MTAFPLEIHHTRAAGTVRIAWEDGHASVYGEEYLRGYCPCAMCQGHGAQRRFIEVPGAKLSEIRGVGNYAVELRWEDGHSTGIYTFEYLRAICPCAECAGEPT